MKFLTALAAALLGLASGMECDKFLVLNRPLNQQVVYSIPPSKATRQLFWHKEVAASQIAVDSLNMRLFMLDSSNNRIVWTNLIVNSGNCRLMTDGVVYTAVEGVQVQALALDPHGALFYAGRDLDATEDQIYEVPLEALNSAARNMNDHRLIVSSSDGNIAQPTAMATDGFHLYWANHVVTDEVIGKEVVTIARAGVSAFNQEATSSQAMVNSFDAKNIGIGPTHFYFCHGDAIYGMPRSSAMGTSVALVNNQCAGCSGMVADALGTAYVACDGEVYSFPTGGELTVQNLDYVLTQPDLGNIQLLQTQGSGAGRLEVFGLLAFLSSLFIFFF